MNLAEIKFIPEMWKARLSKYWITTVEELISILGQDQGSEQIAKILEVNSQEFENFTQQLKKEVPEIIFKKYSIPIHPERFKLGALDEEEKKEGGQKC